MIIFKLTVRFIVKIIKIWFMLELYWVSQIMHPTQKATKAGIWKNHKGQGTIRPFFAPTPPPPPIFSFFKFCFGKLLIMLKHSLMFEVSLGELQNHLFSQLGEVRGDNFLLLFKYCNYYSFCRWFFRTNCFYFSACANVTQDFFYSNVMRIVFAV